MTQESPLNTAAVSAASALKITRSAAWQTFAHAQQEAVNANALLIAPSDLLCGLVLNVQAINVHDTLLKLGVERNDETLSALRSNRTMPATMKDILLSRLYGHYREIVARSVNETENLLVERLKTLQMDILPQIEESAAQSIKSFRACNIDEDEAIDAVRELREATLNEIANIQSTLQKTSASVTQRALSINEPAKLLSSWHWSTNKGLPPAVNAIDIEHVFSKESQHILCIAREVACDSWIENMHLLYALAADLEGPGQKALKAISVDPIMLRLLIQERMAPSEVNTWNSSQENLS